MKKILIMVCLLLISKNSTASPVNVSRETFTAYAISIATCTIEVPSVVRLPNLAPENLNGGPYQEISYTRTSFFIGYQCNSNNKASLVLTPYSPIVNGCISSVLTEGEESEPDVDEMYPLFCIYNGSQKINFSNNSIALNPQSVNTELSVIASTNTNSDKFTETSSLLYAGFELITDLNVKISLE